jgi:hypothetical protein
MIWKDVSGSRKNQSGLKLTEPEKEEPFQSRKSDLVRQNPKFVGFPTCESCKKKAITFQRRRKIPKFPLSHWCLPVLNVLWRTSLFRRQMFWLLPSPLPSVSRLSFLVFLCVAGPAYWRERGGGSQTMRRRESLVLYKSFNTRCLRKQAGRFNSWGSWAADQNKICIHFHSFRNRIRGPLLSKAWQQ